MRVIALTWRFYCQFLPKLGNFDINLIFCMNNYFQSREISCYLELTTSDGFRFHTQAFVNIHIPDKLTYIPFLLTAPYPHTHPLKTTLKSVWRRGERCHYTWFTHYHNFHDSTSRLLMDISLFTQFSSLNLR